MNDGKALLAAVCEHPEEDVHRLVYADWLEDNGDPERAEFIRGQIELLRLDAGDPRLAPLAARTEALESANFKRWKREVPRWAKINYGFVVGELMRRPDHLPDSFFHRGFPSVIACVPPEWRRHAEMALARAPIQGIDFTAAMEYINDLLEMEAPHLEPLRAISVGETGIYGDGLDGFFSHAPLHNLRVLAAYLNDLHEADAEILARAPSLAGLTVLDLWGNELGPGGAKALAKSKTWRSLEVLKISHNGFGDEGLKALARSAVLDSVREIDLGGNAITGTGFAALARSKHVGKLEMLHIGFNAIETVGLRTLADAGWHQLQTLDLQENQLGSSGVAFGRAVLPRLQTLTLPECALDAASVETILGNSTLTQLRELDLTGNEGGDRAASAIADAPHLANLRTLDLRRTNLTDQGAAALARSPVLRRVETLDLADNAIGDAGANALAESTALTNLRILLLSGNRIGGLAAAALANAPWAQQLVVLDLSRNPVSRAGRAELKRRLGTRVQV